MSNNFRLPVNHNIYNKNRSVSSSNKENQPNNAAPMNGNTFATPSEDDFDDDDDELLIAASQQVEKKMAQEKAEAVAKNAQSLQLQGEIAILRDKALKLNREKDQQRIKHTEEMKSIEQKFKKEMENLKSKLEFKDRDIEELKSKIKADSSRGEVVQSAKRPRLSVVKEAKPPRGCSTSNPSLSSHQYRVRNHLTPSSAALSKFCSLSVSELNSDSEHRNLAMFARGLRNDPATQKRFNIKPSSQKCVPTKEITSTMAQHFKQIEHLSDWNDRRLCLRILSDLLSHNSYPNVEQEMRKLLAALQKSSCREEHSRLAETLRHSEINVFTFCCGGSGSCMLGALYRYKCKEVTALLACSVVQVSTVKHCSCWGRLVKYVCEQIGDTLDGELSSPSLIIRNESLLILCLQLLSSLAPHFPEMKLSVTSQTLFYGALCHLKRCPQLSMSGLAMVDVLYEAVFELNTSTSMSA